MAQRGKKTTSLLKRRNRFGYFFTAPYILGLLVFVAVPLVSTLQISFSRLTVGTERYMLEPVGFENYRYIFTVDPDYRQYLLSSLESMVTSVPVVIVFSLFVASLLTKTFRGRGLVRTILFFPVIIASGAAASLSSADYMASMVGGSSNSTGSELASSFLRLLGQFDISAGLTDFIIGSVQRIYTIITMSAIPIVIFIAALNSISESIYEAAYIEGCSAWEVFWKIKFPLASPQILTCVVYCIIDNLNSTENPVIEMIQTTTYQKWEYGLGGAMAFTYALIVLVLLALVYRLVNRFIVYSE